MRRSILALTILFAACAPAPQATLKPALDSIRADSLLSEIKTLSSDEFEGRKPGSAGEEKTIAYLEDRFRQIGLKPGNPNGT